MLILDKITQVFRCYLIVEFALSEFFVINFIKVDIL